MLSFVYLVTGFALLVWGADRFVEGACAAARRLGIPSVVVGLTIVAMGTSAPELSVSVTAALKGANEIAVGNVVGSNIFNLLVVVGVSALIAPMGADKSLLRRDMPLSGAAAAALLGMLWLGGGTIGRGSGLLLLEAMAAYMAFLVREALRDHVPADESALRTPAWTIPFNLAVGLAAIILGGDLTVDGATGVARMFGLSEALIGLTIVAIGTSLPELVTSVTAARKGESGLALGNAIGSNIFNILFILGVSAAISPIPVGMGAAADMIVLIAVTFGLWPVFLRRKGVSRASGAVMTALYIAYTAYLILR